MSESEAVERDVVQKKLEEMYEHARNERHRVIDEGDVPELRDGGIPTSRLEELSSWERALYLIGRAETMEMWAYEIEAAMERADPD